MRLGAVSNAREELFEIPLAFIGSPPGQLCNSVVQANFGLPDEAAWMDAGVQAALSASRGLRQSDAVAFAAILAERPWMPIEDPVSGETVPVSIAFGQ